MFTMSQPKTNTPTYVTVLRDPNNKTSYITNHHHHHHHIACRVVGLVNYFGPIKIGKVF